MNDGVSLPSDELWGGLNRSAGLGGKGLLECATGDGEREGLLVLGSLIGVLWSKVDQGVTVCFFTGDFRGTKSLI